MGSGVRVVVQRRTHYRTRAVGLALVLALGAAGCGLRVDHQEVRAATAAAVGSGSTGAGQLGSVGAQAAGSSSPSGQQAVGSGPTSGSTGSGGGPDTTLPGGPAGVTGASGASAGQSPAGCSGGGNGGSTDVGVTANQITIGNVSDLGGPVPGLFQGGPDGTEAYIQYINSLGGVCGRKLKMISQDDQLQCTNNEVAYQNLVNQVFAFVGSWSLDDYCGAQILDQHPTVPAVQQSLSIQMTDAPGEYSVSPYQAGAPTGYFEYFKQKFPDAIGSVGTIVGNQPSAVQSWKYSKATMESLGYKVVYEDDFPPAQNNFTADVIRMRQKGVKFVFIIAVNAPDLAAFSQEAASQGWKPEVFAAPIGYFGAYMGDSGGPSNVEGQYIPVTQAMFLGEDAPAVPEVALFDRWMKSAFPNFQVDQFADTSWAQTALFVQALKMVGPHLTRVALLNALKQIHTFTDNGMFPVNDVAARTAGHCYDILKIENGKYVKVDDPATGFRCDGIFRPYGGG